MKIGGEVLRTLAAYQDHEIFFVTPHQQKLAYRVGQLDQANPEKIRDSFEHHLARVGATSHDGFLYAGFMASSVAIPNVSASLSRLCTRKIADKLDSLRDKWGFERTKNITNPHASESPLSRSNCQSGPIPRKVDARASCRIHDATFWPMRKKTADSSGVTSRLFKSKERRRLPPRAEVEVLLWFARHKPSDFIVALPNIRLKKHRSAQLAVPFLKGKAHKNDCIKDARRYQ